jgi:hypothetical protein
VKYAWLSDRPKPVLWSVVMPLCGVSAVMSGFHPTYDGGHPA